MNIRPLAVTALVLIASIACAEPEQVPAGKQTTLGLYATSAEAFAAWEAAPEAVTIIDVRTPEEFIFVGHPSMAWNVPFMLQTLDWNADRKQFDMDRNPGFVDAVKELAGPADTIYLICRSGGRSAMAVNMLAGEGFTAVWTVVDGMEGDKVTDETNPDFGHRTINGWKNSGLPWTYSLDRERMVLPNGE